MLLSLSLSVGADEESREDQGKLRELRERIQVLQSELSETRGKRDEQRHQVRTLELQINQSLNNQRKTDHNIAKGLRKLKSIDQDRKRALAELSREHRGLELQVRSAYLTGRQEAIKILFNQSSPDEVTRMMTYYRYFHQARQREVSKLSRKLARLSSVQSNYNDQLQVLETLKEGQLEQAKSLESLRAKRHVSLKRLNQEVRGQSEDLTRLKSDEQRLVRLLDGIQKAMNIGPQPDSRGFFKSQRRLRLPIRGIIRARFGGSRKLGDLRWKGLFLGSREGQEVKAVYHGRVVYADWLRGYGLLLIIDHGDGYMSLYGHNQSLFTNVGDWVETGTTVASSGSTGKPPHPGLYFEIRRNGRPQNPLKWCRVK